MMKRFIRRLPGILMLLPSITGVILFMLYPFGKAVLYSFYRGLEDGRFVGLTNYFELFDNSMFHLAIENSLKFLLIALPLIMLVPLLLAILFMNIPRFAAVFNKAVYTTMLLSSAVLMTFVDLLFAKNGLLSEETAALFGLDASQLYQSRFAFPLLVLMYLYKYGGYNYLLYCIGLARIPHEYYEEIQLDGARWYHCLRYITLPSLRPVMAVTLLLSWINSYKIYREAFLIGGYYPHDSIYMIQHFINNNFANMNYNRLCCVSVLLLFTVSAVTAAVLVMVHLVRRRK